MALPAERFGKGAYAEMIRSVRVSDRAIAEALRAAAIDAERQIPGLLARGNISGQVRAAQLQNLTRYLRENQSRLWGSVTRATEAGIRRGIAAAADGNLLLSEYLVAAGADATLARQFELAARYSVESVRSKMINDIQLSPRVYKNEQLGIRRAQKVVTTGLAQNQSAREIAGRVKHLINPNTRGGVSYAAKRLARTEINNAFHATNTSWYDRSPFVEGVKWELSGSHPDIGCLCEEYESANHDGLGAGVFKPENVPSKPHPNCLCFTVAITPSREEFLNRLGAGNYNAWMSAEVL